MKQFLKIPYKLANLNNFYGLVKLQVDGMQCIGFQRFTKC